MEHFKDRVIVILVLAILGALSAGLYATACVLFLRGDADAASVAVLTGAAGNLSGVVAGVLIDPRSAKG